MPWTFPAHQSVVLPLKRWRPAWFDGVALCVGAASPDTAYVLDGSGLPVWPFSHQWLGVLGWCLPVTLVLGWLVRGAAPAVATHVPVLRGYGALGKSTVWATATSAIIGAASHLLLDDLEDLSPLFDPSLSLVAAVPTLWFLVHIGRTGAQGPLVARRPVRFWAGSAVVAVPGLAVLPFLPAAELAHTTGARVLAVATLTALAGAGLCRIGT